MFYLKQFWNILSKNPVEGIIFTLMSVGMISSVLYRDDIKIKISKEFKVKESSYFYSLIPERENIARIARKLNAIPFVSKVEIMKKSQIQKQVKKTLSSLKFSSEIGRVNLNYAGIKVIYKKGLEIRSKELIRNYLRRFVGEKKIIMGNIVDPKTPIWKKSIILKKVLEHGSDFFIVLLFILWIPISFLFKKKLENYTILLEFYQRRQNLNFKISSVGIAFFFLIAISISLFFNFNIEMLSGTLIIVLLSMMAFQFKPALK